jgi:hypothetical protein
MLHKPKLPNVDLITNIHIPQELQTMKFRPSIESAKSLCLGAITLATAIAVNAAPSQAAQPTRIVRISGQPPLVIFDNDSVSFTIGCQPVRDLWSKIFSQMALAGDKFGTAIELYPFA